MVTQSESQDKKAEKLVVIYVPAVTISHLIPSVELGELLAAHGLEVSVVVCGRTDDGAAAGSFAEGIVAAHPQLSFHFLPYVTRPRDVPAHDVVAQTFELAHASNSDLREFLRAASPSPAALVLDFFCGSAVDVGAELGIPTYFFFTASISALAELLYHPLIHEQTSVSLRHLGGELLHVPGIAPIPVDHLPAAWQDRDSLGNRLFLALSEQMCNSHGLIVNSFRSLEPRATDAIVAGLCTPPGRRTPPLHCIGPVIKTAVEAGAKRHECLAWLDAQPEASVVFLCFGSLGRFSAEQTRHVACGLEMSGQRFLWVVRRPPGGEEAGLDALLPEGFLARTKGKGLVVEAWAPQREVLAHGAVGGFVTHCGWNSVLEAIMGGVPMLAWPMYAEQRMNKVFLVHDLRLAVALEGYNKEIVKDEEVAAKVKWLMESEGGRELRERSRTAMRKAKEALSDGGESRTALLELVRLWKM